MKKNLIIAMQIFLVLLNLVIALATYHYGNYKIFGFNLFACGWCASFLYDLISKN